MGDHVSTRDTQTFLSDESDLPAEYLATHVEAYDQVEINMEPQNCLARLDSTEGRGHTDDYDQVDKNDRNENRGGSGKEKQINSNDRIVYPDRIGSYKKIKNQNENWSHDHIRKDGCDGDSNPNVNDDQNEENNWIGSNNHTEKHDRIRNSKNTDSLSQSENHNSIERGPYRPPYEDELARIRSLNFCFFLWYGMKSSLMTAISDIPVRENRRVKEGFIVGWNVNQIREERNRWVTTLQETGYPRDIVRGMIILAAPTENKLWYMSQLSGYTVSAELVDVRSSDGGGSQWAYMFC